MYLFYYKNISFNELFKNYYFDWKNRKKKVMKYVGIYFKVIDSLGCFYRRKFIVR